MSQTRGGGKLSVINNLFKNLDDDFKRHLIQNSNSLFRLLNIEAADMLAGFLDSVLTDEYYDHVTHVFKFEDHELGVTLEDVLYLTGLPVQGKPVIFSYSTDVDGFKRVFGDRFKDKKALSFDEVSAIAVNASEGNNRRKIAVLLIICRAFIVPSYDKHVIQSAYVQFVENVDEVDSYAWGAVLLSCIYHGIKWKRMGKKKFIDGNLWVVLGFFIVRLRKLQQQLGIDLMEYPQPVTEGAPLLLLPWIVRAIKNKTRNRYAKYDIGSFMPLSDEDIIWTPYAGMVCPRPEDLNSVRDITPLFGYNFVEHHMPHLCSKQFPIFESYDLKSTTWSHYEIPFKQRKGFLAQKGDLAQKYLTFHKKQIDEWNARKPAEAYMIVMEREEESSKRSTERKDSDNSFNDRNDYHFESETENRDDRKHEDEEDDREGSARSTEWEDCKDSFNEKNDYHFDSEMENRDDREHEDEEDDRENEREESAGITFNPGKPRLLSLAGMKNIFSEFRLSTLLPHLISRSKASGCQCNKKRLCFEREVREAGASTSDPIVDENYRKIKRKKNTK